MSDAITYERWDFGLDLRRSAKIADANRLIELDNGYITLGRAVKKRPCLRRVANLEAGTVGLISSGGKLNTFYTQATPIVHSDTRFFANRVAHPTGAAGLQRVSGERFNGFLYVAARYTNGDTFHHYLDGTLPTYIVDPNCPNTEGVLKAASKIFAPGDEVVNYCATADARDWTTVNDAGFLPVGLEATGETSPLALSIFRDKMAVHFIDSTQLWTVNPDPSLMALFQSVGNVGTRYAKSPLRIGLDTYFLADQGFRSISIAVFAENVQDIDVGTPIDDLVTPTLTDSLFPRAVYYQSGSQGWWLVENYAWVFSFSRRDKLTTWSRYRFPFAIDAGAELGGKLYLRSGDTVFQVDKSATSDDGSIPLVRIRMPFQDGKSPGVLKQFLGLDAVVSNPATMRLKYDPNHEDRETTGVILDGDTSPEALAPVELCATSIAPVIEHQADEDFELSRLTYYFERLGAV